jgi:threonine synthase
MSRVKEAGITAVTEDSSGNAGCAMAAYATAAGVECRIYVPAGTAPSKLLQIQSYGAKLFPVKGSRQDTFIAAANSLGNSYYASHTWDPYFLQGTKTCAYEIAEQCNWMPPNAIITPVGNGTLLLGLYKGFCDLKEAGIIGFIPSIIGVQAALCNPLEIMMADHSASLPSIPVQDTLAEGIAITRPARAKQILQAVLLSKGKIISVSEDEILEGLKSAIQMGYFIEPTSATVFAALKKYHGFKDFDSLCIILTGHGLKSADKIQMLLK